MKSSDKSQLEGVMGNLAGIQNGGDAMRKEERSGEMSHKVDKGNESFSNMEMKKKSGRGNWQHTLEESKRGVDRFNKQVCGKCKDPRHTTRDCRVGHCLIYGRDNHITRE